MEAQAELTAGLGDRDDVGQRPHATAGRVVGVLDRDDPRQRRVQVAFHRVCSRPDLLRRQPAAIAGERPGLEAAVCGRPAQLGDEDVRVLLREELVARLAVETQRDLVRHRRRREVDGLVVSEKLSGSLLEPVDRRVLALLFVPDLR
jgi:hypothetical protein